jgi:NitT/TauT family transport system substrate-binding protein
MGAQRDLRRWGPVACAALLAIALGSCGEAKPRVDQDPPLRFAYDLWPGYYPVLIAQRLGYFREEGIRVEAIHPENTDPMMADFAAGKYDAIAVALGDIVSLTQAAPDIRVVLKTDESSGADAVVATRDIAGVRDLRGRRVAVNLGGFGEVFITKMLEANGLHTSDVTLVDVDAADVPARLLSGEIQAGHTWEPYITDLKKSGAHVLFSSAQTPGLIPAVIAFRGDVIRDRPAAVRGFVRAWLRAVDYWRDRPAEGLRIAAEALGKKPGELTSAGDKIMTRDDNVRAFTHGTTPESLYESARIYLEFYGRIGTVRTAPDIERLIDGQFIP